MRNMIIVGVDPGIARCGYGVIEVSSNQLRHRDHGVVTTSKELNIEQRLFIIYQELTQILALYKPQAVAVEKLFFAKNEKTALTVGQVQGVIYLCAGLAKVPLYHYTPLEVKQAVTSYGKADKQQIQQMVKLILGLSEIPRPDDAADGLAIAICCANSNIFL